MPQRPKRPCRNRRCPALTRNQSGYCDECHPKFSSNWAKNAKTKRSRHERGYGSEWTNVIRPAAIERNRNVYMGKYIECPEKFKVESFPNMEGEPLQGFCEASFAEGVIRIGTHVDHIRNKESGGTDSLNNLQILSKAKHAAKTGREGAAASRSKN